MMIRRTSRRSFKLESLESRQLLTAGGPSAEATEMLWLLNYARTNPKAMADQVTSNLDPNEQATVNYYNVNLNSVHNDIASSASRPPLAWNATLAQTATGQSQYQANNGVQSHTGAGGSSLDQRLDSAGYTDRVVSGENAYAYSQSVDQAMAAFLIDWGVSSHGHRNNILQPNASPDQYYKEVGIGIVNSNKPGFGPQVITEDFGTQANTPSYLLGVAYNDPTHSHLFKAGEGVGNVEVDATNEATGVTASTETWDAGAYQIPLSSGTYDITAKVNGQVVSVQKGVTIGDQNVEIDYNLTDLSQSGSGGSQSSTSTPAPTSAPTSSPSLTSSSPAPPVYIGPALQVPSSSSDQPQVTGVVAATGNSAPMRSSTPWSGNWSTWSARRVNS
jgi:uncharacterized protein YkwD